MNPQTPSSIDTIVQAWRNERYWRALSTADRIVLPPNPAGELSLESFSDSRREVWPVDTSEPQCTASTINPCDTIAPCSPTLIACFE